MYKEYGQDEGVAGEEEEERRCQDWRLRVVKQDQVPEVDAR